MPISRNGSVKGKGKGAKKIVEGPAVYEKGEAYSLAQDIVKEAPARMNWERVDVLD